MKKRLDLLLVERGLAPTREKARGLIMAGRVTLEGAVADKPGRQVREEDEPLVRPPAEEYVSRGGLKLAGALRAFGVDPAGMTALDVGASPGGFTDCLLRHGAARVYAVDVGYGQLDDRLRKDPRVVVLERANIRYLDRAAIPGVVDLAVVDASFISLKTVLPPTAAFVKPGGVILALVKPQFELGKGEVGKGVVRDPDKRARAVEEVAAAARAMGLTVRGVAESTPAGAKGNVEFFLHLVTGGSDE
jgi:23S rRNA (cytidine1920-2'-O)/16S rRNA (cytidine1409-2'-O)-methyltransferase